MGNNRAVKLPAVTRSPHRACAAWSIVLLAALCGASMPLLQRAHAASLQATAAPGMVYSCGGNDSGQSGDGTTSGRTSPAPVNSLTGIVTVAAGIAHSLAAGADGTVWAWGDNSAGQLGNGMTTNSTTPVQAGTLTGLVGIAGGGAHTLALANATQDTPTGTPTATPTAINTPNVTPRQIACPAGSGFFALYYGFIQNPASSDPYLLTFAAGQPNFLIVGAGLEARSDIPAYLHQHGIQAIQYVAMNYGAGVAGTMDTTVDTAMAAGYDGIFFDQAGTDSSVYAFQRARAAHVKSYGASKLVIMNPGLVPPDASMFDYADIVSVENQYAQQLPAAWGIPDWRWLAVQGDPANQAASSATDAESRLNTFRANGGFWYYSSDYASSGATAISPPSSWYGDFAAWTTQQTAPACGSSTTTTPTGTATQTPSDTPTPSPTNTASETVTRTPTETATNTPRNTASSTSTETTTSTASDTRTPSPTRTQTDTATQTPDPPTDTATATPARMPRSTRTATPTRTPTPTHTPTSTPTATATPTTLLPVISVDSYGAHADGTTDSTAAFQSALAALNSIGQGTLQLSSGTYLLRPDILQLRSHMALNGTNSTLRPTIPGFQMLDIQGSRIAVSGVTLDGQGNILRGLSVEPGSSRVSIANSVIQGMRQSTDPAGSTYRGTPIGAMVYGNTNTTLFDHVTVRDILATNEDLDYASWIARGILITGGNNAQGQPLARVGTNVTIQNSAFADIGPKDDGDAIVIQPSALANAGGTANLRVLNNTFFDIAKRAVKIQVGGAVVSGNTITNDFNGDNLFTAGLTAPVQSRYGPDPNATEHYDVYAAISIYASNVQVTNNVIAPTYGTFYRAVEVTPNALLTTGLLNVVVNGNQISVGSAADPGSGLSQSLIRLEGDGQTISKVHITNNRLSNAVYGISLSADASSSSGVTISGNTLTNVGTAQVIYG